MPTKVAAPGEALPDEGTEGRKNVCAEQRGGAEEGHAKPDPVSVAERQKPERFEEAIGCEDQEAGREENCDQLAW
jgi:hypothetical protein